jgi:hypothetical protein
MMLRFPTPSPLAKPGQYDGNEVLHCSEAKRQHIAAAVLIFNRVQVICYEATV